jgi:hypothetical protein
VLFVVALLALCFTFYSSRGSTSLPISVPRVADSIEPRDGAQQSSSTYWHQLSQEYELQFSILVGVDVNVGNSYDLKQLSRRRAAACSADAATSTRCTDYTANSNETLSDEPMNVFVARCAAACLAIRGDGVDCTAFVILYEGECILKRFLLTHRLERPDAVSYVRRVHNTTSSDIVTSNTKFSEDQQFRRKLGFAVITSVVHLHTRLLPALQSWLCHVDAVMLMEDDALSRAAVRDLTAAELGGGDSAVSRSNETPTSFWGSSAASAISRSSLHPKCLIGKHFVFESPPEDGKVRSYNGAWKNFPLITHVYQKLPLKSWYMMVDDDSFVILHNLNVLIHSVFERVVSPQNRAMMFGAIFRVGGTKELFVQGGAGILMTRAAVQLLRRAVLQPLISPHSSGNGTDRGHGADATKREGIPQCFDWCQQWAGDVRLGCCARMLGVAMKHDFTFWSEDAATSIATRRQYAYFPTTMHQMKEPAVTRDMHAAVQWVEHAQSCSGNATCRSLLSESEKAVLQLQTPADFVVPRREMVARFTGGAAHMMPLYWEPLVGYLRIGLNVSWLPNRS